jgi:hypothetical protein
MLAWLSVEGMVCSLRFVKIFFQLTGELRKSGSSKKIKLATFNNMLVNLGRKIWQIYQSRSQVTILNAN